jgi:hypothetical protein
MSLDRPSAAEFRREVVASVALNCLLAMDFVPNSKPPSVREMTSRELPRVLACVVAVERLSPGIEAELRRDTCDDPADLLERVVNGVKDLDAAARVVKERGHVDHVYSALMYTRKPPTATCERIRRIAVKAARVLGVEVPEDFDQRVGDRYDNAHGMLVKV